MDLQTSAEDLAARTLPRCVSHRRYWRDNPGVLLELGRGAGLGAVVQVADRVDLPIERLRGLNTGLIGRLLSQVTVLVFAHIFSV